MHPNPHLRSTEVCDRGRKPGKKFQVNCRVDAKQTHSRQDADGPKDHGANRGRRDGEDVSLRDQLKDVDNKPVFLKGGEIDVITTYDFCGKPYSSRREDRGTLLGQLHDYDPPGLWSLITWWLRKQFAKPGKKKADRRKDDTICLLKDGNTQWKTHLESCLTFENGIG